MKRILHSFLATSTVIALFFSSVLLDAFSPSTNFRRRQLTRPAAPFSLLFHHRSSTTPSSGRYSSPYSDSILNPYSSVSAHGDDIRREWVDKSLNYYSKVMREERRRNLGQVKPKLYQSEEYNQDFLQLAKKHYFALRKIKDGKHGQAELIYRRIIDELRSEEEECDHAKLAVTTLLLALHMQRSDHEGSAKETRSVFLNFFRTVVKAAQEQRNHQCACSAKVLQAFALFEMKQGNSMKALEIVVMAVKLDPTLRPVLNWKQFRDVLARRRQQCKERVERRRRRQAELRS